MIPSLGACSGESTAATGSSAAQNKTVAGISAGAERREGEPMDVIARVGSEPITFREINTMINSAAIVGLSMPELGSPERDTVRITLLDKLITANLLYLDALEKGVDKDPGYQREVAQFRDAVLAKRYRSEHLIGEIVVTEQDVLDFYKTNISEETELNEELKAGIEATIRKQRMKERIASIRERLREGHKSVIAVSDLDPEDDQVRSDDDEVANLDGVAITWGEVKSSLQRAKTLHSVQARIDALEEFIDNRLMAQQAKAAGIEDDLVYKARVDEFSKTHLINLHRGQLVDSWVPEPEDVKAYYKANKDRIIAKEVRKVQMLVVETEEEADSLKQQIESKEITFHQAVQNHSIIADAAKTLGQIGWVSEGSGFPELDKETFLLEAGEIGGPVESPAGWHLVRVLDQRDALYTDISDETTYDKTRRMYLEDKLNRYVIDLRREHYPVEINEEMIAKLSQQEIDWYQEKLKTSQKSPEEIRDEINRLRKAQ